jgi:hypothetical protein
VSSEGSELARNVSRAGRAEVVEVAEAGVLKHYELMKVCAEKLAALKKCQESSDQDGDVETAEEEFLTLQRTLHAALAPQSAATPTGHNLDFLNPYLPSHAGQMMSIGSIPHAHGVACVGPCRFHRKGKCFDGSLCRFCHFPDDHPGAVKKTQRKPKKARAEKPLVLEDLMPAPAPQASSSQDAFARWQRSGCQEFQPFSQDFRPPLEWLVYKPAVQSY